jgi:hypothetical protein
MKRGVAPVDQVSQNTGRWNKWTLTSHHNLYLCQSHFRTTVSSVTRYKSAIGTRPVQYARSISLYYASEAEL